MKWGILTRRRWRHVLIAVFLLAVLVWPARVSAHDGAPYLVFQEQAVGPYTVTVWIDPDVGNGTFFVETTASALASPVADMAVTVWARPKDNDLPETAYQADQQAQRGGQTFVANVPFDRAGPWAIRLGLDGPAGPAETAFTVQVRSPSQGKINGLLLLLPFVAGSAVWLVATFRQTSAADRRTSAAKTRTSTAD